MVKRDEFTSCVDLWHSIIVTGLILTKVMIEALSTEPKQTTDKLDQKDQFNYEVFLKGIPTPRKSININIIKPSNVCFGKGN